MDCFSSVEIFWIFCGSRDSFRVCHWSNWEIPPKNPNEESEMSEAEEEGEEESDAWGYSYGTFQPRNIQKLWILKPNLLSRWYKPKVSEMGIVGQLLENERIEVCRLWSTFFFSHKWRKHWSRMSSDDSLGEAFHRLKPWNVNRNNRADSRETKCLSSGCKIAASGLQATIFLGEPHVWRAWWLGGPISLPPNLHGFQPFLGFDRIRAPGRIFWVSCGCHLGRSFLLRWPQISPLCWRETNTYPWESRWDPTKLAVWIYGSYHELVTSPMFQVCHISHVTSLWWSSMKQGQIYHCCWYLPRSHLCHFPRSRSQVAFFPTCSGRTWLLWCLVNQHGLGGGA